MLTTNGKGAVFDVAAEDLDMFLTGNKSLSFLLSLVFICL